MRTGEQTSKHLLLAVITTIFSSILCVVILLLDWELWIIPLILAGGFGVWFLHIARIGSDFFYESLCAGLLLLEFFFSAYMKPACLISPLWLVFWYFHFSY